MSTVSKKKPSPLRRCLRATRRALRRTGELFALGAAGCARFVDEHGDAMGGYSGFASAADTFGFPCALEASWEPADDVQELACGMLLSTLKPGRSARSTIRGAAVVGRIDEDAECEFGDELPVGSNLLRPRMSPSTWYATAGFGSRAKLGTCQVYKSRSSRLPVLL